MIKMIPCCRNIKYLFSYLSQCWSKELFIIFLFRLKLQCLPWYHDKKPPVPESPCCFISTWQANKRFRVRQNWIQILASLFNRWNINQVSSFSLTLVSSSAKGKWFQAHRVVVEAEVDDECQAHLSCLLFCHFLAYTWPFINSERPPSDLITLFHNSMPLLLQSVIQTLSIFNRFILICLIHTSLALPNPKFFLLCVLSEHCVYFKSVYSYVHRLMSHFLEARKCPFPTSVFMSSKVPGTWKICNWC